jgi:hypothetical protein
VTGESGTRELSDGRPGYRLVRREDVEAVSRAAGGAPVILGSRRGFSEDTGPIELVVLSFDRRDRNGGAGSPPGEGTVGRPP